MKTISFFSFKGGVGRTALLMNMAIELVRRGRVVAVMDMDVAAPGLSYSPLIGPCLNQRGETFGVSDILNTFKEGLPDNYRPGDTIETIRLLSPKHLLRRVFLPRTVTGPHGQMVALAAGAAGYRRPDPADKAAAGLISHISRPAPQEKTPWPILARAIRTDLEDWRVPDHLDSGKGRAIDYLLIDSRTGFDELVDFSLGRLADEMVLVSGLNDQNLRGLSITLEALQQERLPVGELRSQLTVVFSPVPATEDAEVFRALDQGRRTIAESLRLGPHGLREEGPRIRTLHYTPLLALGDRPVTLDHPQSIYAREVAEITELLHSDEDLEARKADVRTQTRKVQETWTPTAPPAGPPTNIYADLPPWHWPFGPGDDEKRAAFEKNLRTHPFTEFDEERLANLLAWSLGLSVEEKRQILTSIHKRSQYQIDQIISSLEKDRDEYINLALTMEDHIYFQLSHALIGWATLAQDNRSAGLDRAIECYEFDRNAFGHRLGNSPHLWLTMLEALIQRGRANLYTTMLDNAPRTLGTSGTFWRAALGAHDETRNGEFGFRDLNSTLDHLQSHGKCNTLCQITKLVVLHNAKPQDNRKIDDILNNLLSLMELSSFNTNNIDLLLDLGSALHDAKGRNKKADDVLEQAFRADPASNRALILISLALTAYLGRHNDAEQAYRNAINSNDKNSEAWNSLGIVLTKHLGRHEEAKEAYRNAVYINENNAEAWNNLGNVLTKHLGQHRDAETAYRKAIKYNDKNSEARNNLGNVLTKHLGRHRDAETAYRRAIEIDENNAPAWNNLGIVLTDHLGQHQEAEKAYRRAIEIDENFAYTWNGLRELYWRHGRCREAESCARQGLAIETGTDPIRPEILWNLAMLRLCLGHPDDARDLLQKARDAIHEPADLDLMQLAVAAALGDSALLARAQARRAEVLARQDGRTIAHALLIEGLVVPERLAEAKEVAWRHVNNRPRLLRHLENIHFICGLRPKVRARGQALAAELLDLLDRFPERFTDVVALPDAWFDRYRPFAAGQSDGAGDPRDRARFCPDA